MVRNMSPDELARRIDEGLHSMPPVTRHVFEQHRFDDKSFTEIAALLGLHVQAVERHLAAAMLHLDRAIHDQR